MSDNQRRYFCQFIFMLACAIPTVIVGYWICHPQTAAGWEQTLQAKLGVNARVEWIETPGPYITILHGLELTDPEVGMLFKTVEAEINFGQDSNVISIPYRVQGLNEKGLACLIKNVNQHLIRSHGVEKPWQIRFPKETIVSRVSGMTQTSYQNELSGKKTGSGFPAALYAPQFLMSNLQVDVFRQVDGTFAQARFKAPGSNAPDHLVECLVSRTKEYGQMLVLESNEVALPCWLVSDSVDYVPKSLADNGSFLGRIEFIPTKGNSQLSINGAFSGADLQHYSPIDLVDHRYGTIELKDCLFENGFPVNWEAWIKQGSERMPINQNVLFNTTQQFAADKAIQGTLNRRWSSVADQPKFY